MDLTIPLKRYQTGVFEVKLQMLRNKLGKEREGGGGYNQKASARLVQNYCWNFINK